MHYNISGQCMIYHNEEGWLWNFVHSGWGDESEY